MTHADAAAPTAGPRLWNRDFAWLALAALGVVFGDIGTSPLYALRECFHGEHGVAATPANVVGVCSLIVWSLALVIAVKYLVFVMRADNCGEGGVLALMALVRGQSSRGRETRRAISVLSAVEGINVATTALQHVVVPITVVILVGLFLIQPLGTARVGGLFGPVLALWFVIIASSEQRASRAARRSWRPSIPSRPRAFSAPTAAMASW